MVGGVVPPSVGRWLDHTAWCMQNGIATYVASEPLVHSTSGRRRALPGGYYDRETAMRMHVPKVFRWCMMWYVLHPTDGETQMGGPMG